LSDQHSAPAISDIYRHVNEADDTPGFAALFSGNWLAWPIIKVHILWALMAKAGSWSSRMDADVALFDRSWRSRLGALVRDVRTAARRAPAVRDKEHILLVGVHKPIHDLQGRSHDFFFGDLARDRIGGLGVEFVSFPLANDPAEPLAESLAPLLARARLLTLALMPFQMNLARALHAGLRSSPLPGIAAPVSEIAALLAHFHARRILFGRFLAARRPRLVAFTYAPGRMAEVAAAREAGIPVLELQHGVFGPADPDYHWSPSLKSLRSRMPLPERIAVFGEAFRKTLCAGGFWGPDEVKVCGCAAFDLVRAEPTETRSGSERRVTVFSQSLFRDEIRRVLLEVAALKPAKLRFSLVLHPAEINGEDFYRPVIEALPGLRIIAPGQNSLRLMLAADDVVACNSLALLEACSLGRRALSVTRPDGTAGLRDLIQLKDLDRIIKHVATGKELIHALDAGGAGATDGSSAQARAFGESLYALGWPSAIRSLITEMLARDVGRTS
jgi:hypothetical protein